MGVSRKKKEKKISGLQQDLVEKYNKRKEISSTGCSELQRAGLEKGGKKEMKMIRTQKKYAANVLVH